MTREELDNHIRLIKNYGDNENFETDVKQLIRDVIEALTPDHKPNGTNAQEHYFSMGNSNAIDTIKQNTKELLG